MFSPNTTHPLMKALALAKESGGLSLRAILALKGLKQAEVDELARLLEATVGGKLTLQQLMFSFDQDYPNLSQVDGFLDEIAGIVDGSLKSNSEMLGLVTEVLSVFKK